MRETQMVETDSKLNKIYSKPIMPKGIEFLIKTPPHRRALLQMVSLIETVFFKTWVWRDGRAVKRTGHFYRGSEFGSQHIHGGYFHVI